MIEKGESVARVIPLLDGRNYVSPYTRKLSYCEQSTVDHPGHIIPLKTS
jgi:hypothetical protein